MLPKQSIKQNPKLVLITPSRVSVQGVKLLGGHFACLCREFDFYEVKKYYYFSKRKWKFCYLHF